MPALNDPRRPSTDKKTKKVVIVVNLHWVLTWRRLLPTLARDPNALP
ncbi:hypothetical protein THARTR1_00831 [Trichoderma harzianum]|uniref:Uncharacterized protein n=1 Tax=Trichoderma harzianum TaxID=5544 RepID=A0A2K0UNH2_TRIHA|nr:hypothetical protein THARTR1_00831 [Trichoderma harzianum]